MDDYFYIQFSPTEQAGQTFIQDAHSLDQLLQRLQSTINNLYASGLQGAFMDELQARCDYIFNALRYFCDESDEAGQELLMVVRTARELDAVCAKRFAENKNAVSLSDMSIGNSGGVDSGTGGIFGGRGDPGYEAYTSYGLGNAAWDAADLVSTLAFNKGGGEIAAIAILKELGMSSKAIASNAPIVGGVISGLMDYQLEYGDGPINYQALATEVSSGVLQAVVGGVAMIGNTIVQLGGHALTYTVHQNAETLAGGDPALAHAYRRQANDLNVALEAGNLDNAFDAVTGNIIEIAMNKGSLGENVGDMASGVGQTISGVGQIAFEYQTMRTVMAVGKVKEGANTLMDALQVDEGFQQSVNQGVDMAVQDLQDLNLADLSSFKNVAERRIDYFRNIFGI